MAQGLLNRFTAGTNQEFIRRVSQALIETAVSVYSEQPQPQNHAARAAYAVTVVTTPPAYMIDGTSGVTAISLAVARLLTQQGLDDNSLDSDILNGVAAVWNALAGA